MSSSGGVFSQTLQSITHAKLAELFKNRTIFEDQKTALLTAVHAETDQKKRLQLLLDGLKEIFHVKSAKSSGGSGRVLIATTNNHHLKVLLNNVQRFLDQARYDPSVSPKLLQNWEESLLNQLEFQALKYQYANLYGELVNEWLSTEKDAEATVGKDSEEIEGFEKVDWKEKDEMRAAWEDLAFQPFETDEMAINTYLTNLFGKNGANKQVVKALDKFHARVKYFEAALAAPGQFDSKALGWVINGLLTSDLLTDEKKVVLKDFLGNPTILSEVADVLEMRISSLASFQWEEHVPLEMRRSVNGDSHIYMHEDLLQAMFLQYIGVRWSVFLKSAFKEFSDSPGVWTSNFVEIPEIDRQRREHFLGHQGRTPSVQSTRQTMHKSRYFLSHLFDGEEQQSSATQGEVEAIYENRPKKKMVQQRPTNMFQPQTNAMQQQQTSGTGSLFGAQSVQKSGATGGFGAQSVQKRAAPNDYDPYENEDFYPGDDGNDEDDEPKSPMQTKQFLLHLLSTEIILNTELHGEITCLQSSFKSWNPNLPHSTIISVLAFLGVSKKWLQFFKTFLEAPLKFIEDGPSGQIKKRKRGVPHSHVLSDVFGEAILFCLDYSVNQFTRGTLLYRMHDDVWFWSTSHETVVEAWNSINQFASTMGVSTNPGKTGTVRIFRDEKSRVEIDPSLPKGEIRWGFLYLDSSGRFIIDQKMVDTHILELQRQLKGKTSIFSYIQAWNTYAGTFFTNNFGKPANCFGRKHVDMMLSTLERIQRCIFPTTSEGNMNSIVSHLKNTIADRFGITDIPDGWIYFTTALGGLELHNPFIGLLQLRDSLWETPSSAMTDFLEAEKEVYERAKRAYESGSISTDPAFPRNPRLFGVPVPNPNKPYGEFLSFSEFTQYREEYALSNYILEENPNASLHALYEGLLKRPKEESILRSPETLNALKELGPRKGGIVKDWGKMTPYWRWVVQLYGGEMVEKFGGLNAVDANVLPMGMVGLVRGGRVKWQG